MRTHPLGGEIEFGFLRDLVAQLHSDLRLMWGLLHYAILSHRIKSLCCIVLHCIVSCRVVLCCVVLFLYLSVLCLYVYYFVSRRYVTSFTFYRKTTPIVNLISHCLILSCLALPCLDCQHRITRSSLHATIPNSSTALYGTVRYCTVLFLLISSQLLSLTSSPTSRHTASYRIISLYFFFFSYLIF